MAGWLADLRWDMLPTPLERFSPPPPPPQDAGCSLHCLCWNCMLPALSRGSLTCLLGIPWALFFLSFAPVLVLRKNHAFLFIHWLPLQETPSNEFRGWNFPFRCDGGSAAAWLLPVSSSPPTSTTRQPTCFPLLAHISFSEVRVTGTAALGNPKPACTVLWGEVAGFSFPCRLFTPLGMLKLLVGCIHSVVVFFLVVSFVLVGFVLFGFCSFLFFLLLLCSFIPVFLLSWHVGMVLVSKYLKWRNPYLAGGDCPSALVAWSTHGRGVAHPLKKKRVPSAGWDSFTAANLNLRSRIVGSGIWFYLAAILTKSSLTTGLKKKKKKSGTLLYVQCPALLHHNRWIMGSALDKHKFRDSRVKPHRL